MNHKKPYFPLLLFYFLLLLLPIIDYLYHWTEDANSPGVAIRAILITVMLFGLANGFKRKTRISGIFRNSVFIMLYVAFVTLLSNPDMTSAYALIKVLYPFFGFLFVYKLTQNTKIKENGLTSFYYILIIILAITVYLNTGHRMNTNIGLNQADNTGYALACAYASIVFFAKRKSFSFILFLILVGTLISGKRGAIISVGLSTIPLLQYVFSDRLWKNDKKILFFLLIAIGFVLAWHFFDVYIDASLGRMQALEDDGGSGRDIIAQRYINGFKRSSLSLQIFGHGLFAGTEASGSVYALGQAAAHNDWIEMLYDFGILGLLLYILLFVRIMALLIRRRKEKNLYYSMLLMSVIIWLVKSIFSSTFLMDVNSIYLYMTAAYAIAKLEQNKIKRKILFTKPLKHDPPAVSS